MQIQMRGKRVGVERLGKQTKQQDNFLVMPETVDALGVIRYIGEEVEKDLQIGMKVYYGNKRERLRMGDADIEVMDEDNVYAIVKDSDEEQTEASA